jgi:nitrous oxidase accessory protein NosD
MNRVELVAVTLVVVVVFAAIMVNVAEPQSPRQRVFIRSNGNVEPSSAPIQRNGDKYTFTGDIYAEFVVEKSGVVVDGAGYTLHGPYNGTRENLFLIGEGPNQVSEGTQIPYSVGVDLGGGASDLTIMNLKIMNFSIGTYIWTANNVFVGNSVSECIVGVLLSGSDNDISRTYLAKNEIGLFFGTNLPGTVPLNLTVSHNSFQDNVRQLGGCLCQQQYNASEPIHTWDDGREGNYWSDYNGTDANGDGIGDTPYVFDAQNEDRYPLMENPLTEVTPAIPVGVEVVIVAAAVVAALIAVVVFRVKRKRRASQAKGFP